MATIKSYTDIEQSHKLAKILPLNTADMCYKCIGEDPYDVCLRPYSEWKEEYKGLLVGKEVDVIPCWSLAVLFGIIPQEIFDGEYIINITEGINHKWIISYEPLYEVSSYINTSSDSLIDCCVEMIIKLKERKLL